MGRDRTEPRPNAVVELRRYRLHPGERESLIELFEREVIETQEAVGIRVIGQFRDLDAPDEFVWLRGFADIPPGPEALEAFYTGPVWAAHRDAANRTMINSDNVLLLRPAQAGPAFAGLTGERFPQESVDYRQDLITTTVCHLAPGTDRDFAEFFEASVRPVLEAASTSILGTFLVERSPNTFPRLPVREGETVFVWVAGFPSLPAYERHLAFLAHSPEWIGRVHPEMDRRTWRANEVSRLVPTRRSLLAG